MVGRHKGLGRFRISGFRGFRVLGFEGFWGFGVMEIRVPGFDVRA